MEVDKFDKALIIGTAIFAACVIIFVVLEGLL
jgi:hypothetical protein